MTTARASTTQKEVVIEIPAATGSVLHLRMTLDASRFLRKQLETAEREIERRFAAEGQFQDI